MLERLSIEGLLHRSHDVEQKRVARRCHLGFRNPVLGFVFCDVKGLAKLPVRNDAAQDQKNHSVIADRFTRSP